MAKRRRKRTTAPREMFASRGKGLEMTIKVDTELLHILDAYSHDVEELTGVKLTRRDVLQGLLRKVWRSKLIEASALAGGAEHVSDQIEGLRK